MLTAFQPICTMSFFGGFITIFGESSLLWSIVGFKSSECYKICASPGQMECSSTLLRPCPVSHPLPWGLLDCWIGISSRRLVNSMASQPLNFSAWVVGLFVGPTNETITRVSVWICQVQVVSFDYQVCPCLCVIVAPGYCLSWLPLNFLDLTFCRIAYMILHFTIFNVKLFKYKCKYI